MKNRIVDFGTLAEVLFLDVVRQFKLPAVLSSVDAANWYDSVAHAIAALAISAFGVPNDAVQVVFKTIEKMKYFYEDSLQRLKKV